MNKTNVQITTAVVSEYCVLYMAAAISCLISSYNHKNTYRYIFVLWRWSAVYHDNEKYPWLLYHIILKTEATLTTNLVDSLYQHCDNTDNTTHVYLFKLGLSYIVSITNTIAAKFKDMKWEFRRSGACPQKNFENLASWDWIQLKAILVVLHFDNFLFVFQQCVIAI